MTELAYIQKLLSVDELQAAKTISVLRSTISTNERIIETLNQGIKADIDKKRKILETFKGKDTYERDELINPINQRMKDALDRLHTLEYQTTELKKLDDMISGNRTA